MRLDPNKDAQDLKRLIDNGHVSEEDIPLLVNEGLSPETVAIYWKNKEGKMNNVQDLIDKLASAVSFKFKEDATSPGVTISKLRHGYYCSVVRYPNGGAMKLKSKVIVCKAEGSSLEDAVKGVAKKFVEVSQTQPDPLQELGNAVRSL